MTSSMGRTDLQVRWLYHFTDFLTGNPLAVLPMRDVQLSDVLSGASDGEGQVALTSPQARSQDVAAATTPRRALCFAQRLLVDPASKAVVESSELWAGLVLRRTRSLGGRSVKLNMVTLPGYWQRRLVGDHEFVDADPLFVQRVLFAEACMAGWDGTVPPVFAGLNSGALASTAGALTTSRIYKATDMVTALSAGSKVAVEAGFDWRLVPYLDPVADRRRVRLEQGWPRLGRIDAADLSWSGDHNRTRAGFAASGDVVEDGSAANNRITVLGEGTGSAQLRATAYSQTERDSGMPVYEGTVSSSSLNMRTQAEVDERAAGSLAAGLAAETQVAGIKVRGDLEPRVTAYLPGDDVALNVYDELTRRRVAVVGQLIARTITPPEQTRTEMVTMDVQGTAA